MNMISGLEVRRQAKTESSQEAEQGKMQANHAGRERLPCCSTAGECQFAHSHMNPLMVSRAIPKPPMITCLDRLGEPLYVSHRKSFRLVRRHVFQLLAAVCCEACMRSGVEVCKVSTQDPDDRKQQQLDFRFQERWDLNG